MFVTPGTYRNTEAQLVFMTNQGAPLSLNLQTFIGGFFGGDRVTLSPTVRARLGDKITTELAYTRNDVHLPEGDFTTNLAKLRVSYSFTTRAFLQGLVQYNDRADLWSVNVRLRMAAGGQHRPLHRLQRHAVPLRPGAPARAV